MGGKRVTAVTALYETGSRSRVSYGSRGVRPCQAAWPLQQSGAIAGPAGSRNAVVIKNALVSGVLESDYRVDADASAVREVLSGPEIPIVVSCGSLAGGIGEAAFDSQADPLVGGF
jgi:hypothetical protein